MYGPSMSGVQCFLSMCFDYADKHEIVAVQTRQLGCYFHLKLKLPAAPDVFVTSVSVNLLIKPSY